MVFDQLQYVIKHLTLTLLNLNIRAVSCFEHSVDPDQLAKKQLIRIHNVFHSACKLYNIANLWNTACKLDEILGISVEYKNIQHDKG